jgi:hypothetical protein
MNMRLRVLAASTAAVLAGCGPLPKGVKIDLANGSVSAGTCVCTLPTKAEGNEQQPPR